MNRTRATRDAATSSPKTAGAPRWRDKERARTRKQILSAARRVFADRGFYKSRLDDIARLAGLGKGTLYSYFSNKADLVAAVLEDTIDQQLRTVERAVEGKASCRARIEAVARTQLKHFARNRYLLRIYSAERALDSEQMKETLRPVLLQKYARYTELLAHAFSFGMKRGELKRVDAREMAHLFIAVLHAVCWYWHMYGVVPAPEKEAKMICGIIFDGLGKS